MAEINFKAIVFTQPGKIIIDNFKLPPCGKNEIIAQTIYSFVSPGTELRVLSGLEDWIKPNYPFIPGYSWVGRIVEVGSEVIGWKTGELVTGRNPLKLEGINQLWGGQAGFHRCEVSGYDAVLKLPDQADPWDYITAEVASISWRGTSITYPAKGETAVVIGQGLIGAFAAKWLLYHNARVIVTDMHPSRLERARKWGALAAIGGNDPNVRKQILKYCENGVDIAIECSGSNSGAQLASSILREPWPKLLKTNYPQESLHNDPHIWPRLVFLAGYLQKMEITPGELSGGEGTLVLKPGDRTIGDRLSVIERIRCGELYVNDFVSEPIPVSEAPNAYLELRDHPNRTNALAFAW